MRHASERQIRLREQERTSRASKRGIEPLARFDFAACRCERRRIAITAQIFISLVSLTENISLNDILPRRSRFSFADSCLPGTAPIDALILLTSMDLSFSLAGQRG
jgi:hypothetical protein